MNKKRKGFGGAAFLIQALVYCVLIGIITNSSLNLQSSQFSSLSASRVELEAQQWAEIIANEVKLTGYDTIADQARKPIDGSSATWESDISVGPEKIVGDDPDNKIKIVTVNVYKPGDSVSKFALKVPLSTQGTGKFISEIHHNKNGYWCKLENGLIIQWGTGFYQTLISYPIPFKTLPVLTGSAVPNTNDSFYTAIPFCIAQKSTTNFMVSGTSWGNGASGGTTMELYWFAIGI